MNEQTTQAGGLAIGDVMYVLFRRKWLIVIFAITGVLAAAAYYLTTTKLYVSEAKLLIRYVLENKEINPTQANESQIKSPDARGDTIISSEMEIITSLDLAKNVVDKIRDPDRIVAVKEASPAIKKMAQASYIARNVTVNVPRKSSIISIHFRHKDPQLAQEVLDFLVAEYLKMHVDIHHGGGIFDAELNRQIENLQVKLLQSEKEIEGLKTNLGVISIEDSKKSYLEEMSKIRQELLLAEAELAEKKAMLGGIQNTNDPTSTNTAPIVQASPDQMNTYRDTVRRLTSLGNRQSDLLATRTEADPQVRNVQAQIGDLRKSKEALEQKYPSLVALGRTVQAEAAKPGTQEMDTYRVAALEARVKSLNNQLEQTRTNALKLDRVEVRYHEILRRKEIQEANYSYYAKNLEQSNIDQNRGPGNISNIRMVQTASFGAPDASKLLKICGGLLAGGFGAGIALAFLLEMVIDRSIKRPGEVEKKLHLPLFLWVPDLDRGKQAAASTKKAPKALLVNPSAPVSGAEPAAAPSGKDAPPPVLNGNGQKHDLAVWDEGHEMRVYFEALRDRLATYFEINNLNHKPKLVAITSPSSGAGVSTMATGLAAALSETGDGNVLLVDMNLKNGAIHPFQHGKPLGKLTDALEDEHRDETMVRENFYMVSGNVSDDKLPRIMPKRFTHLVPRMKASDYDFIIFDMPPVDQTSITPRLATHMDMTLFVVEAGKTPLESVQRAVDLLKGAKAEVGVVLNRKRDYVPPSLLMEG